MNTQKVIILVGNIGTGKTTWIQKYLKSDYLGPEVLVVDVESISIMLAGKGSYEFDTEKVSLYTAIKKSCLAESLLAGYSVILDGTHIAKKNRKMYIDVVKNFVTRIDIEVIDLGRGDKKSLRRRIRQNRGISPDIWKYVHTGFYNSYESPSINEGINTITTL